LRRWTVDGTLEYDMRKFEIEMLEALIGISVREQVKMHIDDRP